MIILYFKYFTHFLSNKMAAVFSLWYRLIFQNNIKKIDVQSTLGLTICNEKMTITNKGMKHNITVLRKFVL